MDKFKRVTFNTFVPKALKDKVSPEEIRYWLYDLSHRINRFDHAQSQRRQEYLERHDMIEGDEDWLDYNYFASIPVRPSLTGLKVYASDMIEELFGDNHPARAVQELDRAWFEEYTQSADSKALRQMPYKDYLQTDHWKRIRNSMLMLNGARCSGLPCGSGDSFWGGGEHMLHVHHLSYKNRGAEKYADLALVCDDCHAAIHAGRKDILWVDGMLDAALTRQPRAAHDNGNG